MKKITLILMACAMVALSSCGNKKKAAQDPAAEQENFEIQQLEANLQAQLDSIAVLYTNTRNPLAGAFASGKVVLSESEKAIKPDYLVDPAETAELTTLAQKYRAIVMLYLDEEVADIYGLSKDGYSSAIAKLVSDINDPALKKFITDMKNSSDDAKAAELLNKWYNDEVQNGRINLFWEMSGAMTIESLFIISQNIDKFTAGMTDADAENLTYRLFLAKYCIDQLVAYYPEMESLSKSLAPLDVLNAMDMAEFKQQLSEMKGQLEVIRNSLLD